MIQICFTFCSFSSLPVKQSFQCFGHLHFHWWISCRDKNPLQRLIPLLHKSRRTFSNFPCFRYWGPFCKALLSINISCDSQRTTDATCFEGNNTSIIYVCDVYVMSLANSARGCLRYYISNFPRLPAYTCLNFVSRVCWSAPFFQIPVPFWKSSKKMPCGQGCALWDATAY